MGGHLHVRTFAALAVAVFLLASGSVFAQEGAAGGKGGLLYAHEGINVRGGPGLKHPVIGRLAPGDPVEIVRNRGEWGEIRRGRSKGYVLLRLLKEETLPPLQIVNWKWRKAPRVGRRGVVVWIVEVRNNTDQPVDHLQVEFRTLDKKGKLLESAITHLRGIKPGKVAGSRSFASYTGREASAQVSLLAEEANDRVGKNKSPAAGGGGGRGGLPAEADED